MRQPSGHTTFGFRDSSGRGVGSNQGKAFAGIFEKLFAGVIRRMVCESAAILPPRGRD